MFSLIAPRAKLIFISLLLIAAGCSAPRASLPQDSKADAFGLPALSSLAGKYPPRATSYAPSDLSQSGELFDQTLPYQLTVPDLAMTEADMAPSYAPGGDFSTVAYCIYRFQLPGYNLNPEVLCNWNPGPGTAWVGLANWSTGHWDLFAVNASHKTFPASFTPYFDASSNLLVATICTGSAPTSVYSVSIGSTPPEGELSADVYIGHAPLTVNFTLGSVSDADGTVKKIEWDLNGDGVYDIKTGMVMTQKFIYFGKGYYPAAVRLTDNDGAQTVIKTGITVDSGWLHTYGASAEDTINSVDSGNLGIVYAAGSIRHDGVGSNLGLLMKFDKDGNTLWAKTWDCGGDSVFNSVAVDPVNDCAYVTGTTRLPQASFDDALVQKYDKDGTLVWSKSWGGADTDQGISVAFLTDSVYVGGNTYNASDDEDIFLIKLESIDGELVWDQRWASLEGEKCGGVCVRGGASPLVVLAGTSYNQGNPNIVVATFDISGVLQNSALLGDGAWDESGESVCADSHGIYVGAGFDYADGRPAQLLVLGFDDKLKSLWSDSFDRGQDSYVTGVACGQDGHLLLCGYDQYRAMLYRLDESDGLLVKALQLRTDSNRTLLFGVHASKGGVVVGGEADKAGGAVWQDDVPSYITTGTYGIYPVSQTAQGSGLAIADALTGTVGNENGTLDSGGGGSDGFIEQRTEP